MDGLGGDAINKYFILPLAEGRESGAAAYFYGRFYYGVDLADRMESGASRVLFLEGSPCFFTHPSIRDCRSTSCLGTFLGRPSRRFGRGIGR